MLQKVGILKSKAIFNISIKMFLWNQILHKILIMIGYHIVIIFMQNKRFKAL